MQHTWLPLLGALLLASGAFSIPILPPVATHTQSVDEPRFAAFSESLADKLPLDDAAPMATVPLSSPSLHQSNLMRTHREDEDEDEGEDTDFDIHGIAPMPFDVLHDSLPTINVDGISPTTYRFSAMMDNPENSTTNTTTNATTISQTFVNSTTSPSNSTSNTTISNSTTSNSTTSNSTSNSTDSTVKPASNTTVPSVAPPAQPPTQPPPQPPAQPQIPLPAAAHITECWKFYRPAKSGAINDARFDHFSWVDKDSAYLYTFGGCAIGNHIQGCSSTLIQQDLATKSWSTSPVDVGDSRWPSARGAAYCNNPATGITWDFGGTRSTNSGSEMTNWIGSLQFLPLSGRWEYKKATTTGTFPPVLEQASLTCYGSTLIVFGGFNDNNVSNTVYAVSTSGEGQFRWFIPKVTGQPPSGRSGHTATLIEDSIYVFGGNNGQDVTNTVFKLKIPANRESEPWVWSQIMPANPSYAPTKRSDHAAVSIGNRLFIFGGFDGPAKLFMNDVKALDIALGSWIGVPLSLENGQTPPMSKKASAAVGARGSEIIITGGCSDGSCQDVGAPWILDLLAVCNSSCRNNATYQETDKIGSCNCLTGFKGKFCEQATICVKGCKNGVCTKEGVCQCTLGYGGDDCGVPVCPNNCNGANGVCGLSSKRCVCNNGYWDLDCSQKPCPYNCMGRGICQKAQVPGTNTTCQCLAGYYGSGCELIGKIDDVNASVTNLSTLIYQPDVRCPNHCAGHGICKKVIEPLSGNIQGRCQCQAGFGGVDCSGECTLHCSGPYQGECTGIEAATLECKCKEGFQGPGCFDRYCARNCSGHGVCQDGKCYCSAPFSGAACELDTSCSGNGIYNVDKCICNAGFGGAFCEQKVKCTSCVNGVCKAKPLADGDKLAVGFCDCSEGWTGPSCEDITCPQNCNLNGICSQGVCKCYPGYLNKDCGTVLACPNNCTGSHGTCTLDPNTNKGTCVCEDGWSGAACADVGCPHQCYSRGKCRNGQCDCENGYSGRYCEVMCPSRCSGNGLCLEGTCKCFPGFGGFDCNSTRTCPGDPEPCNGKGVCFAPGGTCFCEPGYTGADCSQAHTCGGCGQSGICRNSRCYCEPGWEGEHCERQSACEGNCNGRGHCLRGQCFCYSGFKGAGCQERDVDLTCPKNCTGHGICQSGICFCATGYSGEDCSTQTGVSKCIKPSSKVVCEGRGQCAYEKCFCNPGFSGTYCEQNEVCSQGCIKKQGICMAGVCKCFPGYRGIDCSQDEVCPGTVPCSGYGLCLQGRCACFPGRVGAACESTKSENSTLKCDTRFGVPFMGRCFCVPGRTGDDCSLLTQEACPGNCNGRGMCRMGQCFCKPGFVGRGCEKVVSCSKKCLENGVCAYGRCFCVAGWSGVDCDKFNGEAQREADFARDIVVAARLTSEKCKSGDLNCCYGGCGAGICRNNKCLCPGGFAGANCEEIVGGPLTHRCPKNCSSQGYCVLGKCRCVDGFTGETCETVEVLPCPASCSQHGRCRNGKCTCDPGWVGNDCSQVASCAPECTSSGRGICCNGACQCVRGFTGEHCNTSTVQGFQFREKIVEKVETKANKFVGLTDMLALSECSNSCNRNGLCIDKICYCKPGFHGADCSAERPVDSYPKFRDAEPSPVVAPVMAVPAVTVPAAVVQSSSTSYLVLSALSFGAGVVVCMLVQYLYDKQKEMRQNQQRKKLIMPLLNSME